MNLEMANDDMTMLAQNQGRYAADNTLLVKFFYHLTQDHHKTKIEGRPVFKEVPHISITVPGSAHPQAMRIATNEDKIRFPQHWEKFCARENQETLDGTPLSEWPGVTRAQAENFKFLNVRTVEQLANIPDNKLQGIMGGTSMRQKAQAYLEAAKDNAVAESLVEANARIDELSAQLASLAEENRRLADNLDKPRRGRPPKNAE